MFKIFSTFFFIIFFCDFRVVKPVQLTGDKHYEEKHKEKENGKKNKNTLKLVKQFPENNSTNFKETKIELEFNDKIELDIKKIRFQPFLLDCNDVFKYKLKDNKLIINIIKPLNENTTYQINFTDAIKDTDGNKSENIIVSFSTGEELNKGTLKGTVKDLMTNKYCEKCLVALYKTDRFIELENKKKIPVHILNEENPDYFTRTDEKGNFKINYIANGEYFLCAGETMQEKLMSDPKKNKYGFCAEPIIIQNNEINKNIDILFANIEKFKIVEQKADENTFIIKFDRQIKKFSIKLLINSKNFSENLKTVKMNDEQDSLLFNYNNFEGILPDIDKLPCSLTVYDEFGETLQEKVDVYFKIKNKELKQSKKVNIKIESNDKFLTAKSLVDLTIIPEKEIVEIDKTKIELFLKNKVGTKYPISSTIFDITNNRKNIYIRSDKTIEEILNFIIKELKNTSNPVSQLEYEDLIVEITIKPEGIVFNDRSKNEEVSQTFVFAKNFGTINGNVNIKNKHFKVQLLNDRYEIVAEKQDEHNFSFEKIKKGEYFIRLLAWDINSPQWSFGNIYYKKEHDIVLFHEKNIDVINNLNIPDINFVF